MSLFIFLIKIITYLMFYFEINLWIILIDYHHQPQDAVGLCTWHFQQFGEYVLRLLLFLCISAISHVDLICLNNALHLCCWSMKLCLSMFSFVLNHFPFNLPFLVFSRQSCSEVHRVLFHTVILFFFFAGWLSNNILINQLFCNDS